MKKSLLMMLLCLLGMGALPTIQAADEIYGVLSADGKMFTIRYDGDKTANKGVTPDDWATYEFAEKRGNVETIVFDASMDNARPNNLAFWFDDFWSATAIKNMQYLHTDNVTDMTWMFHDCMRLTSIDVNGFNTSKVTKTKGMFQGCKALKKLDVNSFDMAKVTDTREMFKGCTELETIVCNNDWSSLSIAQSADMFKNCNKLSGSNGTVYSDTKTNHEYAHPDGLNGKPGYFSLKYEVYSEFVEATGTLTYYYDINRNSRDGITTLYNPKDGDRFNAYRDKVLKAVIDESMQDAEMKTMKNLFRNLTAMTAIEGLSNLNTANVTDMSDMFNNCLKLTSVDLSSFNTANVTDMSNMFMICKSLTSLDLSAFNTANVTNMFSMFDGCTFLASLDISSFNTANVTNMNSMFNGVPLKKLDLSHFNTSNVWDMAYMFSGCKYLTSIDISSFNTANVTDMYRMFYGCENLLSLNLLSFKTDALKTTSDMFRACHKLTAIYSGEDWNTGKVTESDDMFLYCKALVGGNGTAYDDSKVDIEYARPDGLDDKPGYFTEQKTEVYAELDNETGTLTYYYDDQRFSREGITVRYNPESYNPENYKPLGEYSSSVTKAVVDESMKEAGMTDMSYLFSGLEAMTKIEGLSNLNTEKVTDMSYMFNDCNALTSLDLSSFNTANVTDMSYMFYDCIALISLDLSSFNTANVTNMSYMFLACLALSSLDLSSFNTLNVTDMSYMFGCPALKELDLSSFNTANVTNMEGMFSTCLQLTSLDLSSFNTDNVTDMIGMFAGCERLISLDLSGFYTANVTDMSNMFMICKSLTSLDLSAFNTANVTDMSGMFNGCESLTMLDLRSFNIYNLIELRATDDMFNGCKALTTIYNNEDWSDINVSKKNSEDMFADCVALVGGNGTAYDDSKVDIEYARPDGLDDKPGYFTAAYTHAVTLIVENGTINVEEDVDLDKVPYGTTLHLTATPNLGYEFAGWTNYDPETGLKVKSDTTVTATFNLTTTYRVTAVSADDALGEVTLTFDSEDIISKGEEANDFTVVPNAVGHLVATPKDKYTEFVIWNDDKEDIYQAERDITVTGDFDYIATFHKDSFNVVVTVEGIDPELVVINGAGKYGRGDNVTLTFKMEDEHYDFEEWHFDKNNFEDEATLVFEEIDADHDVQIVFKAKYYTVSATVIPAEGGIVKGQGDYEYGSTYTLTLEPAEGWELKEWRDGEALDEKSNVLTGMVYGDITIECVLQQNIVTYTVTFLDWNATVLYVEKVEEGKDAKGPDENPTREGYKFVGWEPSITNITADLIVIAQYEQNPPTGVENTEYRIQNTDKILRDGHLYILVNDRTYDATGRLVK